MTDDAPKTDLVKDGRALDAEERARLAELVGAKGERETAQSLGVSRQTLARALSGMVPLARESVAQIREKLTKGDARK